MTFSILSFSPCYLAFFNFEQVIIMKTTAVSIWRTRSRIFTISVLALMLGMLTLLIMLQLSAGFGQQIESPSLHAYRNIAFVIAISLVGGHLILRRGSRLRLATRVLLPALFLILFVLTCLIDIEKLFPGIELEIDLALASMWLAGGILLWCQLFSSGNNLLSLSTVIAALGMQAITSVVDISSGLQLAGSSQEFSETVEASLQGLSLVIYGLAVLIDFATPARATTGPHVSLGRWLSKFLFKAEYSSLGAILAITATNAQFAMWRLVNRKKTFADFYAWQVTRKLDRGRAHRTLGSKCFDADSLFGNVPEHDHNSFRQRRPDLLINHFYHLGLERHHTLVDYGCGSLRVGQHLIAQLDAGKYWGMDVTNRFFEDGLKMLGKDLVRAKRPGLLVISPQTIEQVKQLRPDFIISIAVLKHVPAAELNSYFDRLCSLMHDKTTLVVTFSESETEARISGKSWSWSYRRIHQLMAGRLPQHEVKITMRRPQKSRNNIKLEYCAIAARPRD